MSTTLLLDSSYRPLKIINWQKAVCLLTLNKIEVVEEYKDKQLRSTSWKIQMPAVVRLLTKFQQYKKHIKFSRINILVRDKFQCCYCGIKLNLNNVTYDHVFPKSKGGKTSWENIVSSCSTCNVKKRNRTPKEASMELKKIPCQPKWLPVFSIETHGTIPEQWKSYLYWNDNLEE